MLRGHLQAAARMVAHDLADVGRAAERQVHANARGHGRPLHARLLPHGLEQPDQRAVIGRQHWDRSPAKGSSPGGIFRASRAASNSCVHVRRRAAQIADRARETGLTDQAADLGQDRVGKLRLCTMRPSWTAIEQNAQPPKQPRTIWIESLTTAKAGICSFP